MASTPSARESATTEQPRGGGWSFRDATRSKLPGGRRPTKPATGPAALGCALLALVLGVGRAGAASEVRDLLADGLDGWEQRGGAARFELADGVLVGTAVARTPNSFLCTRRLYSDFVLELEFEVDDGLNSGVQIRSHAYDRPTRVVTRASDGSLDERTMPAGRVHGYQVEIDPSPRAWSAGIYDEARRGWLDRPDGEDRVEARGAFRAGEWNRLRVEAVGSSIRTWLNGTPVADLDDDMTAEGFIALQVHSVDDELVGAQVRWRDLRLREVEPGDDPGANRAAADGEPR